MNAYDFPELDSGLNSDQHAIVFVCQQVEIAVRALADITDSSKLVFQHTLFMNDPLPVEDQSDQHLVLQRADKEVAFPAREFLPGVEGHS